MVFIWLDTFHSYGLLLPQERFLILTEGTLYVYRKEEDHLKARLPVDILSLQVFAVENHKSRVLLLKNVRVSDQVYAFYSNEPRQIEVILEFSSDLVRFYDQNAASLPKISADAPDHHSLRRYEVSLCSRPVE